MKPHRYKTNSGEAFRNTILHLLFLRKPSREADENRRAADGRYSFSIQI